MNIVDVETTKAVENVMLEHPGTLCDALDGVSKETLMTILAAVKEGQEAEVGRHVIRSILTHVRTLTYARETAEV